MSNTPECGFALRAARVQSTRFAVLSQADGKIVITAPTEPHPDWIKGPDPTATVTLGWTDSGGTLVLDCSVPIDGKREDSWTLDVQSTQDFLQRRRHIRVSTEATVKLMDGDISRIVSGQVEDISESGMRVAFGEYIPVLRSMPFQFALTLVDDVTLVVMCRIRWTGRTGPLEMQAGFEFIETYESLLTRLRSYVMLQLDTRGAFEG